MGKRKKTSKKEEKPRIHKDLEGLGVYVNEFGEIISNYNVEEINRFLNKEVGDKKLAGREDYEELKKGEKPSDKKKKKT